MFVKQLSAYARVILPSQSVPSSGTTQEACGKRRWSLFSKLRQLIATHIVNYLVSFKLINYYRYDVLIEKTEPFRTWAVIFIQCCFVYHGCLSPCLPSLLSADLLNSRIFWLFVSKSSRKSAWVLGLPNRRVYYLRTYYYCKWNGSYFLESKWENNAVGYKCCHVGTRSLYSWGILHAFFKAL